MEGSSQRGRTSLQPADANPVAETSNSRKSSLNYSSEKPTSRKGSYSAPRSQRSSSIGSHHDSEFGSDEKHVLHEMAQLIKLDGRESFEMKIAQIPTPTGDEVLIKVDAVGLCRMDAELFKWTDVAKKIVTKTPFVPGHECTGTVVKRGNTAKVAMGARVVVENHFFCSKCYQCTHDHHHFCMECAEFGYGHGTTEGGCAEYALIPSRYCYVLHEDISYDEAVLMEPLSIAYRAISELNVYDETVLIIGTGCIGSLGCSLAKIFGAARVIAIGRDANRIMLAKDMGADEVIDLTKEIDLKKAVEKASRDVGVSRICEMSGSDVMINQMFSLLRPGGQIAMVGVPHKPLHIDNVLGDLVGKNLTLKTIFGRKNADTWREVEKLIAQGQLNLSKVITNRYVLTSYKEAFRVLLSGKATKIILYPDHGKMRLD